MSTNNLTVFDLIERMTALIRSEERKRCTEMGLQAVHLQVLTYLERCNKYSDSPAALANYLGMTRGTVSQTVLLLERQGYLVKITDNEDRRKVHLALTDAGKAILGKVQTFDLYHHAANLLDNNTPADYESACSNILTALQKANQFQSFGLCHTCRHFTRQDQGFMCALTNAPLTPIDSEKICQEHEPV